MTHPSLSWDQHDVLQFLNQAEWRQVEVFSRKHSPHKAAPPVWLFNAPKPESLTDQNSWVYADDIADICLIVTKDEGPNRKRTRPQATRLQAPKKK